MVHARARTVEHHAGVVDECRRVPGLALIILFGLLATGSTIPRSAAARFADVTNLLDYGPGGAVVDATGATDTTAAWIAALATGKEVVVPVGVYAACKIPLAANAVIAGFGKNLVTVRATLGCNGDVFVGPGSYALFG